ncbi:hypothetical protein, partial [Bacillus paranthracis]|uniref:hypothetical protein n=1 Tax=Bacillus paranthracis TaxID=2026186 RepID=UPI002E225522|nr:hypothetical protein [Bacillus paranthracis]
SVAKFENGFSNFATEPKTPYLQYPLNNDIFYSVFIVYKTSTILIKGDYYGSNIIRNILFGNQKKNNKR